MWLRDTSPTASRLSSVDFGSFLLLSISLLCLVCFLHPSSASRIRTKYDDKVKIRYIQLSNTFEVVIPSIQTEMQPNRLGLGLRPPLPSYGQGPSISALAQQQQILQQQQQFIPPQPRATTLFIGSISGGITDAFLNQLLGVRNFLLYVSIYSLVSVGLWSDSVVQTSYHTRE